LQNKKLTGTDKGHFKSRGT